MVISPFLISLFYAVSKEIMSTEKKQVIIYKGLLSKHRMREKFVSICHLSIIDNSVCYVLSIELLVIK